MVGSVEQFLAFRKIFQRHLAGASETELDEISHRLELLENDVRLRREYLKNIKPENIIGGKTGVPL